MNNGYVGDLVLFRGLPGSGKSTLADLLVPVNNVAADDYFDRFHAGVFKPEFIKNAHSWCTDSVELKMQNNVCIIGVHNTLTQQWEMQPYFDLAEQYWYRVHTVVVENRHGSDSVHNVPDKSINKMRNRFEVSN